jgi:hypothetical protein
MEHSSYEITELYVMKAKGKARLILILLLPFSLAVNLLSFIFYRLFRILSTLNRPRICLREILKFFPGLFHEIIITFRRSFTGVFEVDAESIHPSELAKLKEGKPIVHPLFGKSILIEIELLNKLKGKIIHIRPKDFKGKKAS